MWRLVVRLRREEGDLPGSRQAAANARIYANRTADGRVKPPRYRIPKRIAGYVESDTQTDVTRYECDAPTIPIPFSPPTSTALDGEPFDAFGTAPQVHLTKENRNMATTTTITEKQAAKATADAARTKALKTGEKIAKLALKELPEYEFNTGSKGRSVRGKVTVEGVEYAVIVNVIDRSTVTKAAKSA